MSCEVESWARKKVQARSRHGSSRSCPRAAAPACRSLGGLSVIPFSRRWGLCLRRKAFSDYFFHVEALCILAGVTTPVMCKMKKQTLCQPDRPLAQWKGPLTSKLQRPPLSDVHIQPRNAIAFVLVELAVTVDTPDRSDYAQGACWGQD
eukprot:1154240-Pelagomonas_calceolata.AAC.2